MSYAIIFVVLLIIAVLLWNLVPSIREKMRGKSTIVETALAGLLQYFGVFSEALQEAYNAGYIPENYGQIVTGVICLYIVVKRFQTKTPVVGVEG